MHFTRNTQFSKAMIYILYKEHTRYRSHQSVVCSCLEFFTFVWNAKSYVAKSFVYLCDEMTIHKKKLLSGKYCAEEPTKHRFCIGI